MKIPLKWAIPAALALLLPGVLACRAGDAFGPNRPGAVEIGDADLRVLFVGNSLTYTNNLPALVSALAEAAGESFAWATIARPGYSLQEHWLDGLEDAIRATRPDVVVLQQGPSTLPESREHLVHWTTVIAPVIREVGGEPALYMVWPDETRRSFFPAARASYAAAAAAVEGTFIPAGQTWVEAWAIDPDLQLYGPDRFHPSYLGTLAAAQTIFAVLYGTAPDGVPALADGVPDEVRTVLRGALQASLQHAFSHVRPASRL